VTLLRFAVFVYHQALLVYFGSQTKPVYIRALAWKSKLQLLLGHRSCTNSRRLLLTASKLKLPINWEMATGMSKEAAGRLKISVFQDVIFRLSFHSLRIYFRHVPIIAGKAWIWQRVATPQVRRGLSIEAKASFGAVFHGAFPDLIHSHLFFFGIWEPILSTYLAGVLRPGDTVIDIGANGRGASRRRSCRPQFIGTSSRMRSFWDA
jgi:hypothetical protein